MHEVIASAGLVDKQKTLIRKLSGSQRRRVDVTLGIIGRPALLFLGDDVGVIAGGRLIDIGRTDEIDRAESRIPIVRWRQDGAEKSVHTTEPGPIVARAVAEVGEPQELEIIRPGLEDIYLRLIADHRAGEAANLMENAT